VANIPAYCDYSGKKLLCNTGLRIAEKDEILKKKVFFVSISSLEMEKTQILVFLIFSSSNIQIRETVL
jgi:hypothetical protein